MTSMADPVGSTTSSYDRRGLLLAETKTIEGTAYVTKYAFDANGNRTKVTYPSARAVETTYDFAGRPVTMSGKVGKTTTQYVTAAKYLPFGPMTSMTYGNGLVKSMTYDNRYRLDRLTLAGVADYDYESDSAGNITAIADLTNAAYNRNYAYDDLNRLTTASTGSGLWGVGNYGYDAMGNMTSYQVGARTATLGYLGATPKLANVLEAGTNIPVQYDAAGNELTGTRANGTGVPSEQRWCTPRNSLHLVYLSAAGTKSRPCTVGQTCPNAPNGDTYYEFAYDGRGVRSIERLHNGSTLTTTHFVYAPELTLLGSKDAARRGTGIEAVWFAGAPVAQEVWGVSGSTKWTFTDHLGTPLLQTNFSKAVVWRAEYEPYGNVYAMRAGTKDDQPLRFPGQERLFDGNTGTEERYNIFRWYRSGWGKYTQVDPLAFLGRSSRAAIEVFSYGRGNPITNQDPLGLYTVASNCDDKSCGPPSPGLCGSNPRSTVCIDDAFRRLRDHIRGNEQCRRAMDSFGSGFDSVDVVRSTFRGTPGPRMTCNANDCDPSQFGGRREPHYTPFGGGQIPVCLSLYDGNSLLHELLHWFGVPDESAQQRVMIKRCYPGSEP